MKEIAPRAVTPQEAEVLSLALIHGALMTLPETIVSSVPSLQVIGECTCGCRSIYFSRETKRDARLADTIGRTVDGKQIDIMVWGVEGKIASLDLVDYQSSGELPTAESIGQYV